MLNSPRAERRAPPSRAGVFGLVALPLALSWAWALASTSTGCSDEAGIGVVRPELELDPEPMTLDFGEVVIGRSEAEPHVIAVRNPGASALVFQAIEIRGAAPAAGFVVASAPRAIAPSAGSEIWVRFEPTSPGVFTGTLEIESNDPRRRAVSYALTGVARLPCSIAVTPPHTRLALGETSVLTIEALGTTDCTITRLFTDETLFPFVEPPAVPFTIPAGTSTELVVRHSGTTVQGGVPIREVLVKESEGQEARVTLEGEAPPFGCIAVFPQRLIFEETPVGEVSTRVTTVTNTCSREIFVTSGLVTLGVYYFGVDPALFPLRIPPLGSVDIPVTYAPFSPVGDDGVLIVGTNDAAMSAVAVELFGRAAVPDAAFFPTDLDFGTVVFQNPRADDRSECSSSTRFVQIYNQGSTDLRVSSLELDAAGDAFFEVTGVDVDDVPVADFATGFSVGAGRDARVTLQFAPTRAMPDAHRSTLRINHNAAGSPSEVSLLGRGTPQGEMRDAFTQLSGPKVDILWVIDDSCSMFDEQARLVENLSQFVAYADTLAADYQMAVVTTDGHSPYAGVFEQCFPHPRIITGDYGDEATRREAFECLFSVGTDGSGREAGLGAARNAIVRAQSVDQDPLRNRNAGFLRDDAKLAVVVMSDEEDQSDEADTLLRDYFWSVKDFRRDQVRVHAIAGPVAEPCQTGPRQAQPGYRYYWMTQETGGLFLNICLSDWQPVLQRLGLDTFTPLDEWLLTAAADPATIIVTVDGRRVPADPVAGYTYDRARNSVKLHGPALPPPGARVTVDYSGLCRP